MFKNCGPLSKGVKSTHIYEHLKTRGLTTDSITSRGIDLRLEPESEQHILVETAGAGNVKWTVGDRSKTTFSDEVLVTPVSGAGQHTFTVHLFNAAFAAVTSGTLTSMSSFGGLKVAVIVSPPPADPQKPRIDNFVGTTPFDYSTPITLMSSSCDDSSVMGGPSRMYVDQDRVDISSGSYTLPFMYTFEYTPLIATYGDIRVAFFVEWYGSASASFGSAGPT